jgi:hypothetical protein
MRDLEHRVAQSADVTAWVIRSLPDGDDRRYRAEYLAADLVLLDPGMRVCLERAQSRPDPEQAATAIRRWYEEYTP